MELKNGINQGINCLISLCLRKFCLNILIVIKTNIIIFKLVRAYSHYDWINVINLKYHKSYQYIIII